MLHLLTPKLSTSPQSWPPSPAVAVLHGGTARGIATGSELAGAQAGGHTLALGVPEQPRGAVTTSHTAAQLPAVLWLPAASTAHRGTLLVLLAPRTQDSWAQRHKQVKGIASAALSPLRMPHSLCLREQASQQSATVRGPPGSPPRPRESSWVPPSWTGWLSRLTAEGLAPPGRRGTLLGTAPSVGSEHRAQAGPARGAATHGCQAAQVERLPVHQPMAFLGGR